MFRRISLCLRTNREYPTLVGTEVCQQRQKYSKDVLWEGMETHRGARRLPGILYTSRGDLQGCTQSSNTVNLDEVPVCHRFQLLIKFCTKLHGHNQCYVDIGRTSLYFMVVVL